MAYVEQIGFDQIVDRGMRTANPVCRPTTHLPRSC
jgi:hypothetical protein